MSASVFYMPLDYNSGAKPQLRALWCTVRWRSSSQVHGGLCPRSQTCFMCLEGVCCGQILTEGPPNLQRHQAVKRNTWPSSSTTCRAFNLLQGLVRDRAYPALLIFTERCEETLPVRGSALGDCSSRSTAQSMHGQSACPALATWCHPRCLRHPPALPGSPSRR